MSNVALTWYIAWSTRASDGDLSHSETSQCQAAVSVFALAPVIEGLATSDGERHSGGED